MLEAGEKVLDRRTMKEKVESHRRSGKKVVFTNGCFDLLHIGHVRYLQTARKLGDLLVVGVNSDSSVRRIKGAGRPIIPEEQRAEVLAALGCVDLVTIFDEPDPRALILLFSPDVLVKGADWSEEDIVGAAEVKKAGGLVERIPLEPGISSSDIIERIRITAGGSNGA